MAYRLRITENAVKDMESVLRHTRHTFGELKCKEYRELLTDAIKDIAKDPHGIRSTRREELGRSAFTYHLARPGKAARHFFLCRILDTQTVEVTRLLFDGMDLSRHIPRDY